jgi:D-serine deaminase-like pyridoxal phosphate-dependent protein
MVAKPTLLIDRNKVIQNITKMNRKAELSGCVFRPHFKTHQSVEIGELFRKKGIEKITVSSVSMAEFFAENGWKDITIAFPVNLREIEKINVLAEKINLNLLVDSAFSTDALFKNLTNSCGFFIEIDNGYHRSGLLPEQSEEIGKIVEISKLTPKLNFKGFLTHAGNTYSAKGKEEILGIMKDSASKLNGLKEKYKTRFPEIIASYGDTPSCSLANDLSAFDEVRPGNFVYYDVMQYHIGSCALDEIAVAVACPVVSVYPERNELVIYGGAVHLSKERIEADNGFKLFGYVVTLTVNGWTDPIPGAYVSSLSQEHGIVKMPGEFISKVKPGELLGVLPIHSCLTADLLKDQQVLI